MAMFLVSVEQLPSNPRTWITLDANSNLPRFTFQEPDPLSLDEAKALMARANISCGGTLRLIPV